MPPFGTSGGGLHPCRRGTEYSGYRYLRACWTVVGRTGGNRGEAGTARATALEAGWRETLCHVERRPVGARRRAPSTAGRWTGRRGEYGCTDHTHGRVRDRIVRMDLVWLKKMGENLTVIFRTKAEQKVADRMLSNPGITMEHVSCRTAKRPPTAAPGGGGDPRHSEYDGAELHGLGGHGRPGRSRWRRQGQQGHPGPCRAGA